MRYLLSVLLLFSVHWAVGQPQEKNIPRTILWKISKPGMEKSSYLLGINHVVSADWLLTFPEIKDVIASSDLLMTEFYGDNEHAIFGNTAARDLQNRSKVNLKAMDLLTPEQFKTVDSFFVARVGEGISNNSDAQEMNVWEFSSAILMTLLSDKNRLGVTLPCMDRELFGIFKKTQKNCLALDYIENIEFDPANKEEARGILNKFVEASKTGDYPGWNIADTSYATGKFVHDYKMMNFDYKLDETDPEKSSLIGSHTSRERNASWMPQIEAVLGKNECLIAVGELHLWYRSGLITMLRAKGYEVKPVTLTKKN